MRNKRIKEKKCLSPANKSVTKVPAETKGIKGVKAKEIQDCKTLCLTLQN